MDGTLQTYGRITGSLSCMQTVSGELTIPEVVNAEYYDGPYEFTPSQHQQRAPTKEKLMRDDIIINPIPQNYGLITWDGSVLTVS